MNIFYWNTIIWISAVNSSFQIFSLLTIFISAGWPWLCVKRLGDDLSHIRADNCCTAIFPKANSNLILCAHARSTHRRWPNAVISTQISTGGTVLPSSSPLTIEWVQIQSCIEAADCAETWKRNGCYFFSCSRLALECASYFPSALSPPRPCMKLYYVCNLYFARQFVWLKLWFWHQ